MPILILTARDNWTEKVEGIDAGADDYVAKPFRMEDLPARARHGCAGAAMRPGSDESARRHCHRQRRDGGADLAR
ncbi:response regulator [Cupriavidus oxalaticus]|uniref:response regulator n=1 Tax=Cupriavidus oxalaticus TaxID=96344 RepID=UPI00197ABF7A|nr:response regulator [Cupriavidus oxalaticus]